MIPHTYNHSGLYLSSICKDSHQYYDLKIRTHWNIHTGFPKSLHSNHFSISAYIRYYRLHQYVCPYQSLSSMPISTQVRVQLPPMYVSLMQCRTVEIGLCVCITKDLNHYRMENYILDYLTMLNNFTDLQWPPFTCLNTTSCGTRMVGCHSCLGLNMYICKYRTIPSQQFSSKHLRM